MADVKAIDIMCYLFTREAIKRDWYEQEEMVRVIRWWHLEEQVRGYTVPEFVALLDEAGVDKVCIPAVKIMSYRTRQMIWDTSLAEVVEVVEQRPDRFVGFAGFNPFEGMRGVREVERAVRVHGFRGVYIHSYGFGLPVNDRRFYPLYTKCAELGIPVSMQVGHSAEHMPSEMGRPIHMDDIALDFPELTLIGAHTGWPWADELIALAWKHENVYIGIDAHLPQYLDPSLIRFMKGRGQDKVLYGTNWPVISHKSSLEQLDTLGLSAPVKAKVLRENAARLFRL